MATRNSGMILENSYSNPGNFEVVAPMASGGLVHWWRDHATLRWNGPHYFASGNFLSVAVIESTLGNLNGNLEVVGRVGNALVHYWRGNNRWFGPFPVATGVGGEPGFIQGSWGSPGNFEVVAPRSAGGLGHWWRDAGGTWYGPTVFGAGAFQAAALVQSSFGDGKNLEVVARRGTELLHFWRGSDQAWQGPLAFTNGAAGVPAFVQDPSGALGNFELVCPLAAGGIAHWWRDNAGTQGWYRSTVFAAGPVPAVGLVQSSYGGGKQLDVVARRAGRLEYWRRDGGTQAWSGPVPFFTEPVCDGASQGQCRVPVHSGVVAIHAALLDTGRVLVFGFADDADTQGVSRVLDPVTGALEAPLLSHNLFCGGQVHLPDGSVFVAGGHHGDVTGLHRFDPGSSAWTALGSMPHGRWYPTCTALADGRVFVISGWMAPPVANAPPPAVNNSWQLFDPGNGTLGPEHQVPRFSTTDAFAAVDLYPFCYLLPSGKLLVHSRHTTRFLNPLSGAWDAAELSARYTVSRTYPGQGTSVLLPLTWRNGYRTRVLVAGGGGLDHQQGLIGTTPATASVEILDLGATPRAWRTTTPMHNARVLPDAVLLPDGKVAVMGGSSSGRSDHAAAPVFEVEIFDPATETWARCCPMRVPRLYQSTALLLPDARVMIAGKDGLYNDAPYDYPEHRVEIFSPPYLFQGARPDIFQVPSTLGYGEAFGIGTPQAAGVGSVVLIRAAAVTHGFNMDQRLVELQVTGRTADTLTVKAPPNGNVAPTGLYLLFVLAGGVPSLGRFVTVQQAQTQAVSLDTSEAGV
ncbi:MAG: galactose oxidase-like domain-containing protein [Longimicrobiaceae bacterium]